MGNKAVNGALIGGVLGGPVGAAIGGAIGADARKKEKERAARARAEQEARQRAEAARLAEQARLAEEARVRAQQEAARQEQLRKEQEARAQREREEAARRQREQQEAQRRAAEHQRKQQQLASRQQELSQVEAQWNAKCAALRPEEAKFSDLASRVAAEEKEIAQFSVERSDPNCVVLVALGPSGAGKSTLCNRLAGDASEDGDKGEFKVSADDGLESVTTAIQKATVRHAGSGLLLAVVDTPGANDSHHRDRTFTNQLVKFLHGCGGVNASLLFFDLTEPRFTNSYKQYLQECNERFGQGFWNHVVIVATKADKEKPDKVPQKVEGLVDHIKTTLQLPRSLPLPCVAVGHDNHRQAVDELITKVRRDRFDCQAIKSPIDALKAQRDAQSLIVQSLSSQRDALANRVAGLRSTINSLQRQL